MLQVSVSGYYAWRKRLHQPPSLRRQSLKQLVRNCYWENRRRYGSRRIKAALAKTGVQIGCYRVRELMKEEGLRALKLPSFRPRTTPSKGVQAAPNLLAAGQVAAAGLGQIVIGDITYLPLRNGKFCYLAVWQDQVSRRIIGWSVAETMKTELVITALHKALSQGLIQAGAIIHSDRGSQYGATAFRHLLQTHELRQSMSGQGNCYDNAQAESFFSRFKTKLLENGIFDDVEQARAETFSYIEGYYNRVRLHSSLGYQSPLEFEAKWKTKNKGGKESLVSIYT